MTLVWIDLEMTGLDVYNDNIIEAAVIITDKNLNILAKMREPGNDMIIHAKKSKMDGMNEWCVKQHGESGLTEKVLNSKLSILEAETEVYHSFKD
jgi:oligoribonuclease